MALENLRQWTRKKERAKELGLILADPSLLHAALEEVAGQIKQETSVLKLAMARIELELETDPKYETVETYRQMLETADAVPERRSDGEERRCCERVERASRHHNHMETED